MTWDGFDVIKSVAYTGIAQMNTVTEDMEQALPDLAAKLRAALATEPWGADSDAGRNYRRTKYPDDDLDKVPAQCEKLIKEFRAATDTVRKNVDSHFTTDQAIAEDIAAGGGTRRI